MTLLAHLELLKLMGVGEATEPFNNPLLFSRLEKGRFNFPNLLMQNMLHVSVCGRVTCKGTNTQMVMWPDWCY